MNYPFVIEDVLLNEINVSPDKRARIGQVICLRAPLLNGRLRIIRVIAPKGMSFCDVGIYQSFIESISQWAETFTAAEKVIIRKEQKAAKWKSDDIYRNGPGFVSARNFLIFCVRVEDVNVPIEYVKLQMNSFIQPLMADDHWQLWSCGILNSFDPEFDLVKLVGNFSGDDRTNEIASICIDLENGNTSKIVSCLRARYALCSVFDVGPDGQSGLLTSTHVWRARLLRLLGWPRLLFAITLGFASEINAEAQDGKGNSIWWRNELEKYIEEVLFRYPVINFTYCPVCVAPVLRSDIN